MKALVYKNDCIKNLFLQSMDQYDKYYWTISTITSNTEVYQKLLMNKSKIGEIYIKDYQRGVSNARDFHKEFKGHKNVHFLSKRVFNQGECSIHSKLYLFYTSDSEWRCFIGSYNLTDAAFERNNEIALCVDSDAPGGALFLQDVWKMFKSLSTSDVFKERKEDEI